MGDASVSEWRAVPVLREGVSRDGIRIFFKWGFKSVYSAVAGALPVGDPIILLQVSVMSSVPLQSERCRTTVVSGHCERVSEALLEQVLTQRVHT